MEAYQAVFEYVTLVCGYRLLARAKSLIPNWWGLQKAEYVNSQVVIKQIRASKANPQRNLLALARMLWKNEAVACLRRHGLKVVTTKHPAEEIWQAVADHIPLRDLADEVRKAIKIRGGSGFEKRTIPHDGLCTTESTVPADHLSALSWLLSVQSAHRPR
jgi:hypothetical protein